MKLVYKAKTTPRVSDEHKDGERENMSFFDVEITSIEGVPIKLENYKGKYLLIVNVASKCGFTNQYKDLQKAFEMYSDKLTILGVPCNQFAKQEPGDETMIQTFCQRNYGVTFPLTQKIEVKGKNQHPLYKWLTTKELNGKKNSTVKWNFQKYLIDPQGELVDYYYSTTNPMSKRIVKHLK